MFLGRYTSQIDEQNQLSLPSQYRDSLANGAFVTQGFDRNLLVLKAEAFEGLIDRVQGLNIADPNVRMMFRLIMSNAESVRPDNGGRIEIPATLINFAGLKAGAVIVGQGNYLEIWAPDTWHTQETILDDAAANGARFKDLNVTQV